MTCPRSRHGEIELWFWVRVFLPQWCRSAQGPGSSWGRWTHCCSIDKELCLLSSFPFSSMMCQLSVVESKSATFPSEKARHLLDDSVLESRSPRRGLALASSSAVTNGLSLGKRPRPAHDSRWATARRVCVCVRHCSARGPRSPLQRGLPAGVARAKEAFASQSPRLYKGPWVCPHPASGPERGKKQRTDMYLRPTVLGRRLPKPGGCCPRGAPSLGSHKP